MKYPCLLCKGSLRSYPLVDSGERKQNLQIFTYWKHWFDYHRKGPLEYERCTQCGSFTVNSRSFCRLPVDWEYLNITYQELRRAKQVQDESNDFPTEPFQFVGAFVFGIPYIENVPSFAELPAITYSVAILVGLITWKAFQDPHLFQTLILDPAENSKYLFTSYISYSWIHANWDHFWGNIIVFIIFAPLVEHELKPQSFISLLVFSAVISGLLQELVQPEPLIGFSGVVMGILTFFCLRFPTSIVGLGRARLLAPTALFIYLGTDVLQAAQGLLNVGNISGLGHLGGALAGYLFYLHTPKGPSSVLFEKRAKAITNKEQSDRNWQQKP